MAVSSWVLPQTLKPASLVVLCEGVMILLGMVFLIAVVVSVGLGLDLVGFMYAGFTVGAGDFGISSMVLTAPHPVTINMASSIAVIRIRALLICVCCI